MRPILTGAPILTAALLALLPIVPGCATATGTAASPVTVPYSFFEHTEGTQWWAKPLALPIILPMAPLVGLMNGIQADVAAVKYGDYDVKEGRPFDSVWDPANPEWGERPMIGSVKYWPPGYAAKMSAARRAGPAPRPPAPAPAAMPDAGPVKNPDLFPEPDTKLPGAAESPANTPAKTSTGGNQDR